MLTLPLFPRGAEVFSSWKYPLFIFNRPIHVTVGEPIAGLAYALELIVGPAGFLTIFYCSLFI